MLVIVGILSPFGAAPSSIEGMLYTVLPVWFHVAGFPEVFVQAGLLALLTHYWVNHPEKKWLGWLFGIVFALVILLSILGTLSAAGVLPAAR
jgi:O-antigen ligase